MRRSIGGRSSDEWPVPEEEETPVHDSVEECPECGDALDENHTCPRCGKHVPHRHWRE